MAKKSAGKGQERAVEKAIEKAVKKAVAFSKVAGRNVWLWLS